MPFTTKYPPTQRRWCKREGPCQRESPRRGGVASGGRTELFVVLVVARHLGGRHAAQVASLRLRAREATKRPVSVWRAMATREWGWQGTDLDHDREAANVLDVLLHRAVVHRVADLELHRALVRGPALATLAFGHTQLIERNAPGTGRCGRDRAGTGQEGRRAGGQEGRRAGGQEGAPRLGTAAVSRRRWRAAAASAVRRAAPLPKLKGAEAREIESGCGGGVQGVGEAGRG